MSTITKFPIASIQQPNRQRADYGDIDSLAKSIAKFGIIQPVVIDDNNVLIAGGRRCRAAQQLGWTEVPVIRLSDIDERTRQEMELEENVRRKDITWQERVLAVERIHSMHWQDAAKQGDDWTYEQSAEVLGISGKGHIGEALTLAGAIKAGNAEVISATSARDALLKLIAAKQESASVNIVSSMVDHVEPSGDIVAVETKSDPVFGKGPGLTIQTKCADALTWLADQPDASLDLIYTDPPYAIEMSNLLQAQGGIDTSSVEDTHEVESNIELLSQFIPLAYNKLRDNAWLLMWCDYMHWRNLGDIAEGVGFRRQRWPFIWVKMHTCMNQAAQFNLTKCHECMLVLAMPKATIARFPSPALYMAKSDKVEHKPLNPFWKPLAMHEDIIRVFASPGATICDPFAGSGSIPVAALRQHHSIIAIEKDDAMYLDLLTHLQV